jgi:tetratricopeptide (TPR) repeat protein
MIIALEGKEVIIMRLTRTKTMIYFSFLCGLLLCRVPAVPQQDGEDVVIGKYRVFHSKIFDEDRLLLVHLPSGYESDRIRYPVLYHLYGDNIVDYIAPALIACDKLGQTGEAPPVIIVGVANTNRYRDNLPFNWDGSPGGADNFIRFFREELIPFIDQNYRTESFRVVAGPQAGAKFSLYALMTDPGLFDLYIATNPFEGDEGITRRLLERAEEFFGKTRSLKKFFYFSCEESEPAPALEQAKSLAELVEAHRPDGFELRMAVNKASGFFITPVPVLEALRIFFSEFRLPADFQVNAVADIKAYYDRLSQKYGFAVNAPDLMLTMETDRLSQSRRMTEATELLEYQLSLYPKSLNAFWRLGEVHRALGQYEKALGYYRDFLAIRPTDADMVVRRVQTLERYLKDSAAYVVEQEIQSGGVSAGMKAYRRIRADKQNKLYFQENEFNALGYKLLGGGRTDDAIAVFKLNVEMYPDSANAYDSLGEAYLRQGRKELAIKNYRKSLELDPQNKNAEEKLKELKTR